MKLLKHFRSHPAIIAYSNQSFYANQLLPCGDPAITHSMLRSTVLDGLNPKFPLIFHGVTGCDMQEEGSPSYFNIEEASIVAKYCHELVSDRKVPICTSMSRYTPPVPTETEPQPHSRESYWSHQSIHRSVPQDSSVAWSNVNRDR